MNKVFTKLFSQRVHEINSLFDEFGLGIIQSHRDGEIFSANQKAIELLDLDKIANLCKPKFLNFQLQQLEFKKPNIKFSSLRELVLNDKRKILEGIETRDGRNISIRQPQSNGPYIYYILREEKLSKTFDILSDNNTNVSSLLQVLNELDDAYFSLEENGNIRFLSKAVNHIFGIDGQKYIGKSFKTLPGIKFNIDKNLIAIMNEGREPYKLTFSIPNKNGINHYSLKLKLISLDSGASIIAGNIYNVNQEKEAERLLKISNESLHIINKTQSTFIQTNSANLALDYLLSQFIEITGSKFGFIGEIIPDSTAGRLLKSRALSDISWSDETRKLYKDTLQNGLVFRNNNTLFGHVVKTGQAYISNDAKNDPHSGGLPPGHPPLHNFIGIPLYNGEHFWGMIGLANKPEGFSQLDIDQLKPFGSTIISIFIGHALKQDTLLNQQKVEQKERSLLAILNSLEETIIEMNEDLQIVNLFQKKNNIVQFDEKVNFEITHLLSEENLNIFEEAVKQAFAIGQFQSLSVKECNKNHQKNIWYQIKISPVITPQYKHVSILFENITKLKEAEEELKNLLDKERELGILKSNFISMASHELKNPLSVIQSSAEISNLLLEKHPEKVAKHLEHILVQTEKLNKIMNDVFTLGKLESGKTNNKIEPINLNEILHKITQSLKVYYPKSKVHINQTIQRGYIESDYSILELILTNLIGNALKYNKDNHVVEVTCLENTKEFLIEVKDQGVGISEKDQAKLFESFHRGSNVTNISGTGLGLFIVKKMVETLHGTIFFKSVINQGSTFTLSLPKHHE
jgi:PAS domain S-box-containing protein